MNDEETVWDAITQRRIDRRAFLARMGAAGLGGAALAMLAGCGGGSGTKQNTYPTPTPSPTNTLYTGGGASAPASDADILNFALNLEYLEAEYYTRGLTGSGLTAAEVGANAGAVNGGRAVSFTDSGIQALASELMANERTHVAFLRSALGANAISRPAIDFTNAFNAAAQAASLGASFDAFANQTNFLIGAWLFEEVGVTAYAGSAAAITDPNILENAGGILAVEAYHSGELRHLLYDAGAFTQVAALSNLRAAAGGGKDQPLQLNGQANLVETDANGLVYERTPSEVLRIAYLSPAGNVGKGGFFPNGVNGRVSFATNAA